MNRLIFLAFLAVSVLAGCASTNYMVYQGAPIATGQGGACVNIDGIDIWKEGTPPRKFQVIGVISDARAAGPIAMAGRDRGIAQIAKERGGDGVLLAADDRLFGGMLTMGNSTSNFAGNAYAYGNQASAYGTMNTYSTATAVPMYRAVSKYYVIKYL